MTFFTYSSDIIAIYMDKNVLTQTQYICNKTEMPLFRW